MDLEALDKGEDVGAKTPGLEFANEETYKLLEDDVQWVWRVKLWRIVRMSKPSIGIWSLSKWFLKIGKNV